MGVNVGGIIAVRTIFGDQFGEHRYPLRGSRFDRRKGTELPETNLVGLREGEIAQRRGWGGMFDSEKTVGIIPSDNAGINEI